MAEIIVITGGARSGKSSLAAAKLKAGSEMSVYSYCHSF